VIAAGKLNVRVTLQTPSGSQDSFGQRVRTWSTFAEVWASIAPLSARELQARDAASLQVSHRVTIRWRAGVTSEMRILYGTRVLQIVGIRNLDERNIALEIDAIEGSANA